ncbi:MAG TPA: flagellar filament capping protein FliD [Sporosarcina psychrophila]|uniref:Flagellar hook-associated protein 2 n=1 Tax=Sporosarcina psychrophila TaxID=1476 RepID=A0A921FWY7_SPOPS|nr:flagellar filament capping protein FliD [Sporosarcina psychrophila]
MRIGGMASGMDTDKIIKDLMTANRIPLDKITQKKSYLEWQLNDYRSINRDLKATSDKIFNTMMLEETFRSKNVTSSNPDAVSIKSTGSATGFSGTISIEQLATQATWQSNVLETGKSGSTTLKDLGVTGDKITIEAPNLKGEMETKEVSFNIETDTIQSLTEKINKETGVNAFYDSFSGKFAFTAKNSGEGSINVTGLSGAGNTGQNAKFTFNGLATERASNSFTIDGLEMNLKQVTGSTAAPGTVTFSSAPDTDKVVDAVIQFVNDYNKMIEELNAKIREPKYRDYQPLSAEQKKDMKENEIKLWEEKAMSGTLRNDPTISSMLTKMREALNGGVTGSDGEKIRLSDLGITTSTNYRDNGKLVIDEKKLRQMIAEEPNKVSELFTKTDEGLATKFRKTVDDGQKAIAKQAGSAGAGNDTFTLGSTLKGMNEQIVRFEERMKTVENRLWKQFTAMEMAINRANSQSAQLQSTLGGGM